MVKNYIPNRGDIVWVQFNPQKGHEQAGKRPAIVLSPKRYNNLTKLAVVCPITSKVKGYSFEVEVSAKKIHGAVLADQVRNLDWSKREISFIEVASSDVLRETLANIDSLLQISDDL